MEKDSPSSRTTKSSFFSRSAHFGNVSPFLVGATNTFSELIHPLIRLPNCVLKFYNLSEALGSLGLLLLRGAGTGFVGVLPLPLIFDPPLYILHFTRCNANAVEGLNVINDPKCNKVRNVITFCPKCNKVLNEITFCPKCNKLLIKLQITAIPQISTAFGEFYKR